MSELTKAEKRYVESFEQVPIEELKTPKDGYMVILDRYWVVLNGKALFYKSRGYLSPQCNSNKGLAAYMIEKVHKECEVVFVPVAYVKHNCC